MTAVDTLLNFAPIFAELAASGGFCLLLCRLSVSLFVLVDLLLESGLHLLKGLQDGFELRTVHIAAHTRAAAPRAAASAFQLLSDDFGCLLDDPAHVLDDAGHSARCSVQGGCDSG